MFNFNKILVCFNFHLYICVSNIRFINFKFKFKLMATGKVKFFNRKKGYGFVLDDESQKEIFIHVTGLIDRDLKENDEVSFEIAEDERGKKAVNVKKK